jgi:hypothetical protein
VLLRHFAGRIELDGAVYACGRHEAHHGVCDRTAVRRPKVKLQLGAVCGRRNPKPKHRQKI